MYHIELNAGDISALNATYAYDPTTGVLTRNGKELKSIQLKVNGRTIYKSRAIYALYMQADIPPGKIVCFRDGNPSNTTWDNLVIRKYSDRTSGGEKQSLLQHVEFFRECFEYNEHTGVLTWKARPPHHFASEKAQKAFNKRRAGQPAGTPNSRDNRLQIHFNSTGGVIRNAYAHSIIWVIVHDEDVPDGYVIDHKDRDASNNRRSNLRLATYGQNSANNSWKPGRSGHRGIIELESGYQAWIRIQRKKKQVVSESKVFHTLEQAIVWRAAKERQFFAEFSTQNTNSISTISQFL